MGISGAIKTLRALSRFGLVIGLAFGLSAQSSLSAWADSNPSSPCSDASDARGGQKSQYGDAAESLDAGARTNNILWKVWAGAAAVCFVSCTAIATSKQLCSGANMAAGASESAATRNLAVLFQAIGGNTIDSVAVGGISKGAANSGGEATSKGRDGSACLIGAKATVTALNKRKSVKESETEKERNLEQAEDLQGEAARYAQTSGTLPGTGSADRGGPAGNAGAFSAQAQDGASQKRKKMSPACLAAEQSGATRDFVACAFAHDPSLPVFVRSPRFEAEFEKAAGFSFPDFVRGADSSSGAGALASAFSGGLNSDQSSKLATVLRALETKLDQEVAGSQYAGGAGGASDSMASVAIDGSDLSMGDLVKNFMAQLSPGGNAPKDARPEGSREISLGTADRRPATSVEDRSMSIFDRITYRYSFVGQRLLPPPSKTTRRKQ